MDKKSLGLLFCGILLGGVLGAFGTKLFVFDPKIHEYQSTIRNFENMNRDLGIQKDSLEKELGEIEQSFLVMSDQHNQLAVDYANVNEELNKTRREFDITINYYEQVSDDIDDLSELLDSYTFVKDSISRVLNDQTIVEVSDTVLLILKDERSLWESYENIYDYIESKIEYTRDTEYPYLRCHNFSIDGNNLVSGFDTYIRRNYIQTPEFTLKYKQGDCDDQAVLQYAMMKNYINYIFGANYTLYLMEITLADDISHIAVLQPVQENDICILDPAGEYLTSSYNRIAIKEADEELRRYSEYWGKTEYGEILSITLYDVHVGTGGYRVAFEGTLDQAIDFLSN